MIVYRGTPEPETKPELRDHPCIFFATKIEYAVDYATGGESTPEGYIQAYELPELRLLDLEQNLAVVKFVGHEPSVSERRQLMYYPTKKWTRFVKRLGFEGVTDGTYLCVLDASAARLVTRWHLEYREDERRYESRVVSGGVRLSGADRPESKEIDVENDWSGNPEELGEVSVNLENGSYGVAYVGNGAVIAEYLREHEFFGLASRIRRIKKPVAYFSSVEVPEELARRGIGTAIVEAILTELQRAGATKVFLHASGSRRIDQWSLEEWWERRGFRAEDCCDRDRDIWTVMSRIL